MTERNEESGGGLSRRRLLKLTKDGLLVLGAGLVFQACGGGGGGGGGGAPSNPNPNPNPPPTQTTTVGVATRAQGAVQQDNTWNGLYGGPLITEVNAGGGQVSGDLNYGPFQSLAADSANVNVGSTVTWQVNGTGTGSPVSFAA